MRFWFLNCTFKLFSFFVWIAIKPGYHSASNLALKRYILQSSAETKHTHPATTEAVIQAVHIKKLPNSNPFGCFIFLESEKIKRAQLVPIGDLFLSKFFGELFAFFFSLLLCAGWPRPSPETVRRELK